MVFHFIQEIIEARKEAPLQRLLQDEFGGWPVLESMAGIGYKWNESSFDWQVRIHFNFRVTFRYPHTLNRLSKAKHYLYMFNRIQSFAYVNTITTS